VVAGLFSGTITLDADPGAGGLGCSPDGQNGGGGAEGRKRVDQSEPSDRWQRGPRLVPVPAVSTSEISIVVDGGDLEELNMVGAIVINGEALGQFASRYENTFDLPSGLYALCASFDPAGVSDIPESLSCQSIAVVRSP
jgi:hypothetical protein